MLTNQLYLFSHELPVILKYVFLLNPRAMINRCLMKSFFRILKLCSLIVCDIDDDGASIVMKIFLYHQTSLYAFLYLTDGSRKD